MSKKKIYAVCIIIIVGFLIVSFAVFFGVDHLVTKNKIHATLKDNYSRLTVTDDSAGKNIISDKYSVFLAGETHGTAKNYDAQSALIKMLNNDFGVNNILFELPHSMCIKLNSYLQTGDESILDDILQTVPDKSYVKNNGFKKFFADLKAFNDTRTANKKLRLFGLTAELSDTSVKEAVSLLQQIVLNAQDVPDYLEESWKSLKELSIDDNYSNERLLNVFSALLESADENRGPLEVTLGDDYINYLCMVQSVAATVNGHLGLYSEGAAAFDENTMYAIFQTIYNADRQAKFFGQFGNEHTLLISRAANVSPLAKQINESESLMNRVCSIRYSYINSDSLDFESGKKHGITQAMYEKEFNQYVNTSYSLTLLRLDAPGSIFTQQQMIINGVGKCTAACFQYVMLIDHSPAAEKAA